MATAVVTNPIIGGGRYKLRGHMQMSVGATLIANEGQLLIASWVDVTHSFATGNSIKVDGVEIPLKHFICGTSDPQGQYVCIRVPAFVSLEVRSDIQYAPELIVYEPID